MRRSGGDEKFGEVVGGFPSELVKIDNLRDG
jgi:hypothetical protein